MTFVFVKKATKNKSKLSIVKVCPRVHDVNDFVV